MVQAYEDAGIKVHFLEADENLPYQVFARDSNFMTPYGAVVAQMAQWWRRGEYAPVIRLYQDLGIPIYDMVTAGSFEGGDFDVIEPGCVLIGYGGERTQEHSAQQVGQWFEKEDWEVKIVDFDEFYVHIDLMVCMVAEKLAAVCLETTDTQVVRWLKDKNIEIIPVSFQDTMALGCNVMALGNDAVISTAQSQDLNQQLRARGFTVYDPDVSQFTLGGGGVHCMAQPLRRDPV
jgi:N-dimethylarginine dimethylaminohydrolase